MNFASQAARRGGQPLHLARDAKVGLTATTGHWYSKKVGKKWAESTSWIRISDFQKYIGNLKSISNPLKSLDAVRKQARLGDIVLVKGKGHKSPGHVMIVGSIKKNGEIVLYYHTNDTFKTLKDFNKKYNEGKLGNTYYVVRM